MAVTPFRGGEAVREPPLNLDAEQALLGALLVSNRPYLAISEFLFPEHFGNASHGRIYAAIGKMIERGQVANPITLKSVCEQDEDLSKIGGARYLAQLAGSAVTIVNALDYARAVHDMHLRRQLIEVGEGLVNDAFRQDLDDPAAEQIERAEKRLFDLATVGSAEGGFANFSSAMTRAIGNAQAAFKRDGRVVGVTTGFLDLDRRLGGLHPSDLIILAGRPSMGKTALATNIAFSAAKAYRASRTADGRTICEEGAVVGFFSLEMSSEQLATRVLAEQSGVSSDRIRRGAVSSTDFDRFVDSSDKLRDLPLHIDDTPALTIAALRTRARRLKRQHGLGLIVVDYLQLIRSGQKRSENRVQEISEITAGLKTLAKELSVPVLALSQLSRSVEQREDKRPMLSDLRESGSIEQDADAVMFIYREEYYLARTQPARRPDETEEKHAERYKRWQTHFDEVAGVAELSIAKQRHGPIGTVRLQFSAEATKFSNLAGDRYE